MANLDSSAPTHVAISSQIGELTESRQELLTRIKGLKQDLQRWKSKIETQAKAYRGEIFQLKVSLDAEVENLKTELQDLWTTLQQQQDDVPVCLINSRMHGASRDTKEIANPAEID
ncbi:hypothetical protein C5167_045875 [Papaver somniferum]|uniref:Uncharacterized protein n=1 Tax=Papaver somniferum TaxID=3469 RepID=A0A4Y7LEM5_PAPSO|nr:hypothetical protein C5167_045875 [Papaver somniferum]